MAHNTFTFQFDTIYPKPGSKPRVKTVYRRDIPADRVLERFDQAAEWTYADDSDKPRAQRTIRCSYVWGPGIRKTPCSAMYKPGVERQLEKLGLLAIDRPRIIAFLWADLGDGYMAYKVRKTTEALEGFERPHVTCYDLVTVEPAKTRYAFYHAKDLLWHDRGLWLSKPALIFSQHWQVTVDALKEIPQVACLMPNGKAYLAPCALDWKGADREYPYIKPTRSTRKIRNYRSRWPTAGDVKWSPKSLLIDQYGWGLDGQYDPALALAL